MKIILSMILIVLLQVSLEAKNITDTNRFQFYDISENGYIYATDIDNRLSGVLDSQGFWKIKPQYFATTSFCNGLAIVFAASASDDKIIESYVINTNGDIILSARRDETKLIKNLKINGLK